MAITTIFMINLTLLYCWHRYGNMGFVSWSNKYERINHVIRCYSNIYCSPSQIIFLNRPHGELGTKRITARRSVDRCAEKKKFNTSNSTFQTLNFNVWTWIYNVSRIAFHCLGRWIKKRILIKVLSTSVFNVGTSNFDVRALEFQRSEPS